MKYLLFADEYYKYLIELGIYWIFTVREFCLEAKFPGKMVNLLSVPGLKLMNNSLFSDQKNFRQHSNCILFPISPRSSVQRKQIDFQVYFQKVVVWLFKFFSLTKFYKSYWVGWCILIMASCLTVCFTFPLMIYLSPYLHILLFLLATLCFFVY